MKKGRTLKGLAEEINRQQNNKRDFLPQVAEMEAFVHDGHLNLGFNLDNKELFTAGLTTNGHDDLSDLVGIPKVYYKRMLEHPELLAKNVKHWMGLSSDRRLIRVLDGNVRAILSKKYRRLDNYDLFNMIVPYLNTEQVEIESCEITDQRLYIKGWTHKLEGEAKNGDLVKAGILVQNSEIGKGRLCIKPLLYKQVCTNGMIIDELGKEKYHIGRDAETDMIEYAPETDLARDRTFWLECRDTIRHCMARTTFDQIIKEVNDSIKIKLKDPQKSIELVSTKYKFVDSEKNDLIKHLIEGKDLSNWGLANAVTRLAQDVESYDRSTELESIGYHVMKHNWN